MAECLMLTKKLKAIFKSLAEIQKVQGNRHFQTSKVHFY